MKEKNRSKKAFITSVVACVVSVVTALAVLLGIVNNAVTTKTLKGVDFERGSLDANGKYVESNENLVSMDMNTVDGLIIEINEDATVSYKLAFYNEDEEFVSMTESLTENFDTENIPAEAKYFKVVITPNQVDGENVKVNVLNQNKFVKQLKVTFARE